MNTQHIVAGEASPAAPGAPAKLGQVAAVGVAEFAKRIPGVGGVAPEITHQPARYYLLD